MSEKSVKLPDFPKGKEFEEYISAYFQSAGFYTNRNIIDREVEELFELDLTVYNYSILPKPRIVEIKSGSWGFSDIFKVKGWMAYTGISKGIFIVQKGRNNFDFFREKAKELKITLISIPDLKRTKHYLQKTIKNDVNELDIESWRYSYWVERNFLNLLNHKKKSNKGAKRYKAMEGYYFRVNSGIFFTPNLIDRIEVLYDSYFRYNRLSAKCANEMLGNEFEHDYNELPNNIFRETYYQCKYNDIQISSFIEYVSKLAILKNLVDYLMFKEVGFKRKTQDEIRFLGIKLSKLSMLPKSFQDALEEIKSHSFYKRYPIFWQWFIFLFGGFILKDFINEEYKLLSDKTNIPIVEIPNALKAFDILFPIKGGWVFDNKKTNILELKFFPMPFRGIGANYRRLKYSKKSSNERKYSDLNISNKYTIMDLIKWNNLVVDVLYE